MEPLYKQIFLALGCWCQQLHAAFMYGLWSILAPRLREPDSPIHMTIDQESWIASAMFLAMCPSNMTAGVLSSRYGRKYTYALYLVPSVGAVILMYLANSYSTLFIAFLLVGLSGGAGPIGTLMLAECSSPKYRGTIMDIKLMSSLLGIAAAHILGIYIHWRTLVLINAVPLLIPFITCFVSPDSPAWLASKGRFGECKRAFAWFRGNGEGETDEVERLVDWQQRVLKTKTQRSEKLRIMKVFHHKVFLKSALISMIAMVVYDFSGILTIQTYVDIINAITRDPANGPRNLFLLDMSNLAAMCLSSVAVTKVKRRKLLFSLGIPCVIGLYIFCGVSYLASLNVLPEKISWMPHVLITTYYFLLNVSIIPILHTIQAEVFPLEYRGLGVMVNSIAFGVSTAVVMKVTPSLLISLRVHGLYLVSAIGMSFCLLYFYYAIPETFNQTLQTIECDLMTHEKKRNHADLEANKTMLHD